jgi:hypothetical protein
MNFTDNNPLSMTGEDSFTSINEILARCVLIDTNQTILSNKTFEATTTTTFDGDVELNATTDNTGVLNNTGTMIVGGTLNLNTDIVADKPSLNFTNTGSTIINPQNIMALQVAGTDKFVTDSMNTTIYATSALNLSAGGLNTLQMTSANFSNNFSTQQTYQVNNATKLLLANTATTLNNTTHNIQSGGTNKITTNATTTTLNNDTTNIQSGGTNRITIGGTTTAMDNTNTNIQSGGTNKITTNATTTTLTNDTIDLTGSTGLTISNTTGALRQWSPTMSFGYNTAFTTICDTMAFNSLQNINFSFNRDGLGTGEFRISNSPNSSFLINNTLMELSNPVISLDDGTNERFRQTTSTTTLTNATLTLNDGTTDRLSQSTTATTLRNTTINLADDTPTTRFAQNSSLTTLRNTTINLADDTPTIRFSQNSSATTLRNTTINLTDDTPTTRFTQNNGATTITNTAISLTGTTGALALTTTTGKASIISNTGQIELKTANTSLTSINIENTGSTGGITMKTSGTNGIAITSTSSTGDIRISSVDNIDLATSGANGDITLDSQGANITMSNGVSKSTLIQSAFTDVAEFSLGEVNINGDLGTQGYYLGINGALTAPLISFALTLVPQDYNTTNSQLLIGYPDADTAQVVNSIRFPYRTRVVGWSVSGDADSHSALNLTLTIGTALAGASPTRYFRQTGTLSASAIQSNSATADILGIGTNMTSITTANDADIPSGTRVYFYENTSATMACEMMFVVYFSQVL